MANNKTTQKTIQLNQEQINELYKNLRLIGQKVGDDFIYLREIYNMIDPILNDAEITAAQ